MAREREKYLEEYNFPFCEAATKFEKLAKIGQGTFGYLIIILFYCCFSNLLRHNWSWECNAIKI